MRLLRRRSKKLSQSITLNVVILKGGWQAKMVVSDLRESELDSGVLFLSYEGNTPPSNPDFSAIEQAFLTADISHKNVRLPLQAAYTNGVTTSDPVILIGKRFEY